MAQLLTSFIFLFLMISFIHPSTCSCQKSFNCGVLGSLEFPFSQSRNCGLLLINCTLPIPIVSFPDSLIFGVHKKLSMSKFLFIDLAIQSLLNDVSCDALRRLMQPSNSTSISVIITYPQTITVLRCDKNLQRSDVELIRAYYRDSYKVYQRCKHDFYYGFSTLEISFPPQCTKILMPAKSNQTSNNLFGILSAEFEAEIQLSMECLSCHHNQGTCSTNASGTFQCMGAKNDKSRRTIILVAVAGTIAVIAGCSIAFFIYLRMRRNDTDTQAELAAPLSSSSVQVGGNTTGAHAEPAESSSSSTVQVGRIIASAQTSPSLSSTVEDTSLELRIPYFKSDELEGAIQRSHSRVLGEGGFGSVYYGKLNDGREVAIKLLRSQSSENINSFVNEINVLSRLRHLNLVTLYGCTARRSRDLIIVYEYVPNGTVKGHLAGEQQPPLTWPVRSKIAIEAASALAYLHGSGIIHRDVKTANMLLDLDQHVKVADFGLAKSFAADASHVSTQPHGTYGYLDPEYNETYRLTTKSDVYSFGVVLIELISSKRLVDTTRQRGEVSLADFALNRIQRKEYNELFDSSLGHENDGKITMMLTSTAELAFQCLQRDSNARPSMIDVVDKLKDIQARGGN